MSQPHQLKNPASVASALLFVLLVAGGCSDAPSSTVAVEHRSVKNASPPQFVAAEDGDVTAQVTQAIRHAQSEGRSLLVYVGASWCEPCKRFHDAVSAGQLDAELAGVRFLEFDQDRHGAALDKAGYGGRMIPRFVVPSADGTPGERIEGAVKGEAAVAFIMDRLRPLLEASADQARTAGK